LEHLIDSLEVIIDEEEMSETLRDKLIGLSSELSKTHQIMHSSTKILNFVVNDMLTYAEINGGRFRQNVSSFNIQHAVEEVYLV